MKKSWALKWANYLEKPFVRQAKNCLMEKKDTRCCLGHGEIVAGNKFRVDKEVYTTYYVNDNDGSKVEDVLTNSTKNLFEMKSNHGSFHKPVEVQYRDGTTDTFTDLVGMNDAGIPLKNIAKAIRRHYKEL